MRTSRIASGTDIYHVMARGNGRNEIFLDEIDNKYFLKLLIEAKNACESKIYSYCLMGNHYHLLIKTKILPEFCKEVNQTYAHYFNSKYKTVGHVFQSRYKSYPVEDVDYLMCVLRYIHNNPVKAGMTEFPEDYQWSSYMDYLTGGGLSSTYPILKMFDPSLQRARERFVSFSADEDGFDYECTNAQERFIDYRKSEKMVREKLGGNGESNIEDMRSMRRYLIENTCLPDREICRLLKVSKSMYYRKIAVEVK